MEKSTEVKVHPLFPTLKEAAQNPALFFTDHLAILAALPLDEVKENDIKLLSVNVTGARAANNIVRTPEDDVIAAARYLRIAAGSKRSADNLQVDVIVFQEVTSDIMLPALKATFDDSWSILPGEDEIVKTKPQQLTLYRKSRLELVAAKEWDGQKHILTSTFKVVTNSLMLVIHNVWSDYDILPLKTENDYRALLSSATPDRRIVIIGDTNSRMSPAFNDFPKNLTTGIIPYMFNVNYDKAPDDIQIPDHPDGGFYTDSRGKIRQLLTQTVDLTTGTIVIDNRKLKEILGENPDEKIVAIWHQPRAILCLDNHYLKEKLIQDKTIFEFEEHLKKIFNDPKILVRMTSTIFNKKGFIVRFKNISVKSEEASMADLLADVLREHGVTVKRLVSGVVSYPCLFIDLNKIGLFAQAAEMLAQLKVKDKSQSVHELLAKNIDMEKTDGKAEPDIHALLRAQRDRVSQQARVTQARQGSDVRVESREEEEEQASDNSGCVMQ